MSFQRVPFLDVFRDASGGNIKTPQNEFLRKGEIPVVDQGQKLVAGYVNDRARVCNARPPVIVFGDHTRAIKYVDFEFAMGADGTKVLIPKLEADTKFLYYALRAINIPSAGYSRHYKFLKETEIPLPPLAEQKRIAGILDAADALRAKRRESLAQLDSLLQSTFLDMFGDSVTNPMDWELCRLGNVTTIGSGSGFPNEFQGQITGDYPFYKVSDMNLPGNEIRMQIHNNAITDEVREILKAKAHPPGTIIFPKIGAAIATNKKRMLIKKACFDNNVIGIHPSELITIDYLFHLLQAKDLSGFANTGNPPSIRKSTLDAWVFPNPPLDLQRRFAAIVNSVERQRTRMRDHFKELDSLFASLQSRAFSGAL